MADLANNTDQVRCRCGSFATLLAETGSIRRVECHTCGTQTLYGDELS